MIQKVSLLGVNYFRNTEKKPAKYTTNSLKERMGEVYVTKVKLYFDNEVLKAIIAFIDSINNNESQELKDTLYENLSTQLRKSIK